MIPTVIRGHLARPGSPAEAYLVAWSELSDRHLHDPSALHEELARARAWRRSLEESEDPGERALISRRGRYWPVYRALIRRAAVELPRAIELQEAVDWLWLLATTSQGYLGVEA